LAKEGLDESHFLEPLFKRALKKQNPALEYLNDLTNGVSMKELIYRYAEI